MQLELQVRIRFVHEIWKADVRLRLSSLAAVLGEQVPAGLSMARTGLRLPAPGGKAVEAAAVVTAIAEAACSLDATDRYFGLET